MALPAQALTITPETQPQWTGNDTKQSDINAAIAPIIGTATEYYKAEVDGGKEEGLLWNSYQTTFSNTPLDPSNATVEYVGGWYIGSVAYALVKDGNQTPAWYLFNLTALGWTGTETLEFVGFWPNQGAISHVSLYGGYTVPDGGSVAMLLGAALIGLAGLRRFVK
jgi:hypothetical protein